MNLIDLKKTPDLTLTTPYGPDPFGLLQVTPKTQPLGDLPELLQQHNTGVAIEPSNGHETTDHLIPNRVHFIYQVNPMRDRYHIETMARFKRLYPSYNVVLWASFSAYTTEELADFKQVCISKGIHLLDTTIMDGYVGEAESMYQLELLRRNYGASTDYLRYALLERFGGLYTDTDVVANGNHLMPRDVFSPTGIYFHKGKVRWMQDTRHPLLVLVVHNISNPIQPYQGYDDPKLFLDNPNNPLRCKKKYGCSNHFMMATKNHPLMQKAMAQVAANYHHSASELFNGKEIDISLNFSEKMVNYTQESDFFTSLYVKYWTIFCTGPGIIEHLTNTEPGLDYFGIPDKMPYPDVPLNHFLFTNQLTWCDEAKKKEVIIRNLAISDNDAIEIVMTSLLYDLIIEPRYLRLDRYRSFLTEDRAYTIIKRLIEYYPHYLSHAEKAFAGEYTAVFHQLMHDDPTSLPKLTGVIRLHERLATPINRAPAPDSQPTDSIPHRHNFFAPTLLSTQPIVQQEVALSDDGFNHRVHH